jgi:hypothetical protein
MKTFILNSHDIGWLIAGGSLRFSKEGVSIKFKEDLADRCAIANLAAWADNDLGGNMGKKKERGEKIKGFEGDYHTSPTKDKYGWTITAP